MPDMYCPTGTYGPVHMMEHDLQLFLFSEFVSSPGTSQNVPFGTLWPIDFTIIERHILNILLNIYYVIDSKFPKDIFIFFGKYSELLIVMTQILKTAELLQWHFKCLFILPLPPLKHNTCRTSGNQWNCA